MASGERCGVSNILNTHARWILTDDLRRANEFLEGLFFRPKVGHCTTSDGILGDASLLESSITWTSFQNLQPRTLVSIPFSSLQGSKPAFSLLFLLIVTVTRLSFRLAARAPIKNKNAHDGTTRAPCGKVGWTRNAGKNYQSVWWVRKYAVAPSSMEWQ